MTNPLEKTRDHTFRMHMDGQLGIQQCGLETCKRYRTDLRLEFVALVELEHTSRDYNV